MNTANVDHIKTIAWDLDGTLYQSQQDLSNAMVDAFIKILSKNKNLPLPEAQTLLTQTIVIHRGVTKSLEALGCGDRISIIKEVERLVDKPAFLKIDHKLQQVFQDLSHYKHAIVSDTTHQMIGKELEALGLSSNLFQSIVGVDNAKTTKPDRLFFQTLIQQDIIDAKDYLIVGDRYEIDLAPAKELGMTTCLVWQPSPNPSEDLADFVLPAVYNVRDLFIKKE